MRAILIRVGADGTNGGGNWQGPVDTKSGGFVYIPIPEKAVEFQQGCERRFDEVSEPLMTFLGKHAVRDAYWRRRIEAKRGHPMHLDPDFEHLTYGDVGEARGRDLRQFSSGDMIVFYSGLKPIHAANELVYAVVGVYVIDEILYAPSVEESRRRENAHTRKSLRAPGDIVVRAQAGASGRCEHCIPVGEKRGTSNYYLRPEIETAWGGLVKADGSPRKSSWLNMSGVPPLLGDPDGFVAWFRAQDVALVRRNFCA